MVWLMLVGFAILSALVFLGYQIYMYNSILRVTSVSLFEQMNFKKLLDTHEDQSRNLISDLISSLKSVSSRGTLPSKELLDVYEKANERRKKSFEERKEFFVEKPRFPPLPGMYSSGVKEPHENVQ